MAEGNGEDNSSDSFRNTSNAHDSNDGDTEDHTVSDLVSNLGQNVDRNAPTISSNSTAGPSEIPKKEDNPFSFKHFLRSDSSNHYCSQGARPKVYCDGRPVSSISDVELRPGADQQHNKQTRIIPEFSSALPDFVQDHLVIEQCYLGNDSPSKSISVDLNNLPDFTPNRSNRWNDSSHSDERRRSNNPPPDVPLDLPIRPQVDFPLDLPTGSSRSCPPSSEVGVSKSLPDFLADGAVRSQSNDGPPSGQSPDRETDRLRQDLEMCRRQLFEHARRNERLECELIIARDKEQEYTQNLAKALEQVEETLHRSNRRAAVAEKTISKLKQEVKTLTAEMCQLQRENRNLRGDEGASGGPSGGNIPSNEVQSQRLAQELRIAASTAEHSLRQLLTGVDNLRFMAASLENMHRIEERTDQFLSDQDEESGPAL